MMILLLTSLLAGSHRSFFSKIQPVNAGQSNIYQISPFILSY